MTFVGFLRMQKGKIQMEETISTTSEVSEEQTTPDVAEETTQPAEQTIEENATQEPEQATDETEIKAEEPQKNWEQIAKDNQASFTRVSQELAELKKQIKAQNEPKVVDERGKITPEYEQNYRFEVDNREYLTYDNLARRLEPETRAEVERLLGEAKSLYNPSNKTAYNQKMSEIKNYFNADIVEAIALDKRKLEGEMQAKFDKLTQEHKAERAKEVAIAVEQSEDLKALLYQDSENYSPEVFGIVRQMFDAFGSVDFEVMNKAVSSIKALGVKEHLAQQKAQAEKQKAVIPTGAAVQAKTQELTAEYVRNNYAAAVKKLGSMEKADEILMKG
jgi:hypothetical protein